MTRRQRFLFFLVCGLVLAESLKGARPAPKRIVVLAPSTAEIVCGIGACDRIVGAGKFCIHPPELRSRRQVGGLYDPDLEAIISLQPDLLITRGKHDALERLAETLNLPIYHDETDSLKGIEQTIDELGRLLHRTESARALSEEFRKALSDLRAEFAGSKPVRVLVTVSRNPERLANLLTAGRETFLGEMLEVAGGTNVFGDVEMRYPEVSIESIIARQPDVILELMPDADATSHESLRNQWREYSMIPAVRNHRVHILSDENVLIPSPRFVQIIEKVGRLLHPRGESR